MDGPLCSKGMLSGIYNHAIQSSRLSTKVGQKVPILIIIIIQISLNSKMFSTETADHLLLDAI